MSSKEKSDSDSTREMVVISKKSLLEMEENYEFYQRVNLFAIVSEYYHHIWEARS